MSLPRLVPALVLALAASTLVVPTTAVAAPPIVTKNTVDELSCVVDTVEGDAIYFFASASTADGSAGSGGFVEGAGGTVLLRGGGGTADFGPPFAGDVQLADEAGGPAVPLSVRLDLAPAGEPVVQQVDERDGNIRTTGTITTTDYAITVTAVTLPGYTATPGPEDCSGSRQVFDLVTTNPRYHVVRSTTMRSDVCALRGFPNAAVLLSGTSRRLLFVEVVVDDGVAPQKMSGEIPMRGGRGRVTEPLVDRTTGEPVADLTVRLGLHRQGRSTFTARRDGAVTEPVRWTPYRADVVASSTDGRRGTASCAAAEVVTVTIVRRR